jgi:hypothetical protein
MAYLRQCLYELRAASGLAPFEVPSPEPRLAQPAAVRPAPDQARPHTLAPLQPPSLLRAAVPSTLN